MLELSRRGFVILSALSAGGLPYLQQSQAFAATSDVRTASVRFGLDLLLQTVTQSTANANTAISPASIMDGFALADVGASPDFHVTLQKLFNLQGADNFAALRRTLAPLLANAGRTGPVAAFDTLYVDKSCVLKEQAVDAFRALNARIVSRHLGDPETAREINRQVKAATRGAIPSLLTGPLRGSGVVLINALYFKDSWLSPFEMKKTQQSEFHLLGGGTRHVSMMHADEQKLAAATRDGFTAVRLSYGTAGFSLILVVKDDEPAQPSDFARVTDWLAGEGLTDYFVTVSLPRFSFAGGGDILPALDALGLAPARLRPDALAGLADPAPILTSVSHKIAISVDEGGTTAAAATGILAPTGDAPPPIGIRSIDFVANKPFAFALHDDNAQRVLMLGYVSNPQTTQ